MKQEISEELKKWFLERKVEITLLPENGTRTFRSLNAFHSFIEKEITFWTNIDQDVVSRFTSAKNSLEISIANQNNNMASAVSQINAAIQILSNTQNNLAVNSLCIYSSTSVAKYLKKIKEEEYSDEYYNGVKEFLASNTIPIIFQDKRLGNIPMKKDFLCGVLNAYSVHHMQKDIKQYLKSEEKELSEIQSDFNIIKGDFEEQKERQEQIISDSNAQKEQWIKESSEKYTQKEQSFQEDFNKKVADWENKIEILEKQYNEKLQLEAPIKYWGKLKESHTEKGRWFAGAAIALGIGLVIILFTILFKFEFTVLNSEKLGFTTVKGSLILLTMTSLGIYLIHMFAKFAVSSFHLARDAEERKQLTYVFLALLKNEALKDNQQLKEIVYQALFSRADTGLLKGEHAPTMPILSGITELTNK